MPRTRPAYATPPIAGQDYSTQDESARRRGADVRRQNAPPPTSPSASATSPAAPAYGLRSEGGTTGTLHESIKTGEPPTPSLASGGHARLVLHEPPTTAFGGLVCRQAFPRHREGRPRVGLPPLKTGGVPDEVRGGRLAHQQRCDMQCRWTVRRTESKLVGTKPPTPARGLRYLPPQRSLRSLGGLYGVGYVQPAFEW